MTEMPIEEAKKLGAMALFGEKYGDTVRVVNAKDCSIELCGGTHVDNTSKLGLFRIISEGSVAAGVRRIEAVTGIGMLKLIERYTSVINESMSAAKAGKPEEIAERVRALSEDNKRKDGVIDSLNSKIASSQFDRLLSQAVDLGGVKTVAAKFWGDDADSLRAACDIVKSDYPDTVILLALVKEDKVTFAAACGKDAVARGAHAGNLVREIAKMTGGNGGGRPDSAAAGGKDVAKVEQALNAVCDVVKSQIEK